ncbi:hypothetical protein XBJ1_2686 [Xenorhabdus bovienii SS-2004]|uniref:Transposase n=1 Tax=Xenorhabdus bovienii (strain SS-2004) TaxID=406818 RepID=D3V7J8_XENBS|nr:hypothetical protein XBJ1_2686 [Xenorhabdus bovienii SS-2004]
MTTLCKKLCNLTWDRFKPLLEVLFSRYLRDSVMAFLASNNRQSNRQCRVNGGKLAKVVLPVI